jgi:predicted DNA-binding protein (MmcQ/YjbR family)
LGIRDAHAFPGGKDADKLGGGFGKGFRPTERRFRSAAWLIFWRMTTAASEDAMLGLAAIHDILRSKPSAVATRPFGPDHVVYKIGGKMFAIVADQEDVRFTLKCDPVLSEIMRETYAAISPGYHTDKRHWITIRQDDALPDSEVMRLIDHAYDQVRQKLSRAIKTALMLAEESAGVPHASAGLRP